jgi:hypothetical protein
MVGENGEVKKLERLTRDEGVDLSFLFPVSDFPMFPSAWIS